MIPVIPAYISAIVVAAEIAVAAAMWSVLTEAATRSGLEPAAQRRVRFGSALFFGAWVMLVTWLSPRPGSLTASDPFAVTPLVPVFAAVPVIIALVALWRSASLRRAIACIPLPRLHALQSWRVAGVVFLVLLAQGKLPAHFALPAGWGDIVAGVTAPMIALALARRLRGATATAVAWNAYGLLDLVVAVGMGTGILAPLLVPSLGPRVPPAAAMGAFPMMLVPAFAVPVSAMVHVLAFAHLRRESRQRAITLAPAGRQRPAKFRAACVDPADPRSSYH